MIPSELEWDSILRSLSRRYGDDAAAEAVARFWVAVSQGKEIEKPKAWCAMVARRVAVDQYRSIATVADGAVDTLTVEPEQHGRAEARQVLERLPKGAILAGLNGLKVQREDIGWREWRRIATTEDPASPWPPRLVERLSQDA